MANNLRQRKRKCKRHLRNKLYAHENGPMCDKIELLEKVRKSYNRYRKANPPKQSRTQRRVTINIKINGYNAVQSALRKLQRACRELRVITTDTTDKVELFRQTVEFNKEAIYGALGVDPKLIGHAIK